MELDGEGSSVEVHQPESILSRGVLGAMASVQGGQSASRWDQGCLTGGLGGCAALACPACRRRLDPLCAGPSECTVRCRCRPGSREAVVASIRRRSVRLKPGSLTLRLSW